MYVVFWRGEELCRVETPEGILAYFDALVDHASRTVVLF